MRPVGPLPLALSSFVGREHELARLGQLVHEHRLVTLTGPGGTGKTRLAVESAMLLAKDFPDGLVFVDLSAVTALEAVVPAVARAVRVDEVTGRPLAVALQEELRARQLLLVLDNFERVVPAAPQVGALLERCPHVHVLATSREPLRLRGEHVFPVPPLAIPDLTQTPPLPALDKIPSVALFVERAQAVAPDFALTETNAPAVAQLCAAVDGLPLAVELAAARCDVLSPATMLTRVEHRLDVLIDGPQDAPDRHRTLRAAIAWSYDLLSPDVRALFRRLGVFAGGWTVAAAEAVAGCDTALHALDGLASLVRKNLVRRTTGTEDEPRFMMLETIREFALECLQEAGEEDEVRRRHAAYFLALAEEAAPHLRGAGQVAWLDRLEQEHDNLRAAQQWCDGEAKHDGSGTPDAPAALSLRFAAALWQFWWIRGHLAEGQRWLEESLRRNAGLAPARARALNGLGIIVSMRGATHRSPALFTEALALHRQLGDQARVAYTLCNLGSANFLLGRTAQAVAIAEEALGLARQAHDSWTLGYVLHNHALAVAVAGRPAEAVRSLDESVACFRKTGDRRALGFSLTVRGGLPVSAQPGGVLASTLLCQALAHFRVVKDAYGIVYALVYLVVALASEGHAGRAATLAGAMSALRRQIGAELVSPLQAAYATKLAGPATTLRRLDTGEPISRLRASCDAAVATVRHTLGEKAFGAAWAAGQAMSLEEAVAAALDCETLPPQTAIPSAHSNAGALQSGLTPREQEVARLVAQGRSNRQIAQQLHITEGTAANHVEHIMNKLGAGSRVQVAAWVLQQGVHLQAGA